LDFPIARPIEIISRGTVRPSIRVRLASKKQHKRLLSKTGTFQS